MSVTSIGGSPAMIGPDGQPAAWFENWVLNDPRHLVVIAPRQAGLLAERWAALRRQA